MSGSQVRIIASKSTPEDSLDHALRPQRLAKFIGQTENDVAVIKSKVPRWVNLASLTVTLIFIWFGAAQYFLFRTSWQFMHKSRAIEDEGSGKIKALNEQITALESQLAQFKIAINQVD